MIEGKREAAKINELEFFLDAAKAAIYALKAAYRLSVIWLAILR